MAGSAAAAGPDVLVEPQERAHAVDGDPAGGGSAKIVAEDLVADRPLVVDLVEFASSPRSADRPAPESSGSVGSDPSRFREHRRSERGRSAAPESARYRRPAAAWRRSRGRASQPARARPPAARRNRSDRSRRSRILVAGLGRGAQLVGERTGHPDGRDGPLPDHILDLPYPAFCSSCWRTASAAAAPATGPAASGPSTRTTTPRPTSSMPFCSKALMIR
jgi:hypothetical protein